MLNSHSRDSRISFEEEDHVYTIDGAVGKYTSTTTFIKKYFNEFDADAILQKMIRFGTFTKKYGDKTPNDIKLEWKNLGKTASERGTRVHKYIENFYNAIQTPPESVADLDIEIGYFYNFLKSDKVKRLIPYRTEWTIFDDVNKIAGSIDMVFQVDPRSPKKVAIYDWKCSKEIKTKNRNQVAKSPISHLADCNLMHYSLQQNMYKFILEKYYGLEVVDINLVILHRNHPDFYLVPIQDMQVEIQSMLDHALLKSAAGGLGNKMTSAGQLFLS